MCTELPEGQDAAARDAAAYKVWLDNLIDETEWEPLKSFLRRLKDPVEACDE